LLLLLLLLPLLVSTFAIGDVTAVNRDDTDETRQNSNLGRFNFLAALPLSLCALLPDSMLPRAAL
jgi:hypothetical protein